MAMKSSSFKPVRATEEDLKVAENKAVISTNTSIKLNFFLFFILFRPVLHIEESSYGYCTSYHAYSNAKAEEHNKQHICQLLRRYD